MANLTVSESVDSCCKGFGSFTMGVRIAPACRMTRGAAGMAGEAVKGSAETADIADPAGKVLAMAFIAGARYGQESRRMLAAGIGDGPA